MKVCQYFLILLTIILVSGCGRWTGKISGSDLTEIKLGMSKQDVVRVLGKPQSAGANEKFEVYRYWEDHGNWKHVYHELIFVDEKLKLYGLADNPDFRARLELIIKQQ